MARWWVAWLFCVGIAAGQGLMPADAAGKERVATGPREVVSFDAGWRFKRGDDDRAALREFDDSSWRGVDVPHDWSIEGPFDEHFATGAAGAYLPSGVAWYRKKFDAPAPWKGKAVSVEFDGVMVNSDVYLNGKLLGHRPNGYVSFRYELTEGLVWDGANVLAVRCDTSKQPASRWYAGAGIYRHVRVVVTEQVHLVSDSVFVMTPKIAADSATVRVRAVVVNDSGMERDLKVVATVYGPAGSAPDGAYAVFNELDVGKVGAGKSADVSVDVELPWKPALWELNRPMMHEARVRLLEGQTALDEQWVRFGVREVKFEAATGFWINGRNVKLKGVAVHQDGGPVGVAVPLGVWDRRLTALQQLGVNAIRTAHNPPDPGFLDLCDRHGMVVMDETFDCWRKGKNPYDYHLYFDEWSKRDVADTVKRDRNHPCVVLYSAGNEIHDTPKAEEAKEILKGLVQVFHENDPTRPVTQALFRPNVSHDYEDGLADLLDVVGQNYRENELKAAADQKPTRKIIGTENQHGRPVWLALRDDPRMAGQFLWSGIDYLGEAGAWPNISRNTGLMDRTGVVSPLGLERQSWWAEQPVVNIARRVAPEGRGPTDPGYEKAATRPSRGPTRYEDWTPSNLGPHEETVEVYSNVKRMELFLNGKSLGAQARNADDAPRIWKVAFEAGTLQAVADEDGKTVATKELRTAGKAVGLKVEADRKSVGVGFDDVVLVAVTVVDGNGVRVPTASNEISFSVPQEAQIVAVDNGDIRSHEPFKADRRSAFSGRCVAMVRGTRAGKITVSAQAAGLAEGTAELTVQE